MFINPRKAIREGWITFPSWMSLEEVEKCIQPNAIDFTVDSLFRIKSDHPFIISENTRQHRGVEEAVLLDGEEDGMWRLEAGKSYDFASDFYVSLPRGVAAELIVRSSLNRNGLFITSGLYDSGFSGPVAGVIHNPLGYSEIYPHTRIGQIKFVTSDSADLYAGGYNTDKNKHWTQNI